MKSNLEYLKFVVVGLAALYLVVKMFPPSYGKDQFQMDKVAAFPVVDGGRTKPLDSTARISLMQISGRQTYRDANDKAQPAIRWLLEVMSTDLEPIAEEAMGFKVFRIEGSPLLNALGLEQRDGGFAYREFRTKLEELLKKDPLPAEIDQAVTDLAMQTHNFLQLAKGPAARAKVFRVENDQVLAVLGLQARSGFRYSLMEMLPRWDQFMEQEKRVRQLDEKSWDLFDRKVADLSRNVGTYLKLAKLGGMHPVPPLRPPGQWMTLREAASLRLGQEHPVVTVYATVLNAFSKNDVEAFNQTAADYEKYLAKDFAAEQGKARVEVFFNHFAPFYQCSLLYGVVFLLICFSWFGWTEHLRASAFWLAVFVCAVHALAICYRLYLTGRPPVTNLYSSAVFIGWGCVLLCLVLEWLFNNGLGTLVASVLGALTLIVAHNLAATGGDTMEVLVAVLDTNFWLATHVVCVTLGYTATFVAGFFGIAFVVMGIFTRALDRETSVNLTKMTYGTTCFAMFLSFTGTVLGGIWADQSWGRFWGWDPKENGALIIVLWNALLLHARWGGMVKQKGIALIAIGGNIVTAWSWFGVNMLGVGLHSYGFMAGAFLWMSVFVGSQLGLILLGGLLPDKYWLSVKAEQERFKPAAMVKPSVELPATTNGAAPAPTAIKPAPVPVLSGKGRKSHKVKAKR